MLLLVSGLWKLPVMNSMEVLSGLIDFRANQSQYSTVSWLRTRLQISLIKTEANWEQTSSISALISQTSCKQIYVNFCWHWAHCNKELHDEPNKSFAVFYWLLIKSCCLPNRLLTKSTFALKYLQSVSFLWRRLSIVC